MVIGGGMVAEFNFCEVFITISLHSVTPFDIHKANDDESNKNIEG